MQDRGMYQVLGIIGQGSGGIVYKAVHKRLNKLVVIKQIKHSASERLESRTEVDLLKRLKHTYLPQVLDFIQENGETYTVMDFVDGSDFEALIRSGRRFSEKEVRRYAMQLCSAVDYLHRQRPPIIHSDIKPANIMLNSDGDICLIDFNVSLIFEGSSSGVLGGTLGYAPPEQFGIPLDRLSPGVDVKSLVGVKKPFINERSDIFSIGASLYYMLTGVRPRPDYQNKPITECGVKLSDGMAHFITKAMALNPSRRYRSAGEMVNALNNIGKLSRSYIRLRAQRIAVTAVSAAVVAGGLMVSRYGSQVMAQEKEDKYSGYISRLEKYVDSGSGADAQEYIDLAAALYPGRAEPYWYGLELTSGATARERSENRLEYYNKYLADGTGRIAREKLADPENSSTTAANIYALTGECAYYLEDYDTAVTLYKESLFYDDRNDGCYRDLAISYARSGELERAQTTLNKAEALGVSGDNLSLVRGEILWKKGDAAGAVQEFERAAEMTEDDYLLYRTLTSCCAMAESAGEPEMHLRAAALLEQHRDIGGEYEYIVLDMLANEYYLCGRAEEQTADELNKTASTRGEAEEHRTAANGYYENAAGCYRTIYSAGKLTELEGQKYFFNLLEKLGHYDECRSLLEYIRESGTASEDYWLPMSECYLCYYEEYEKPAEMRDYTAFAKAYGEALAAYQKYLAAEPGKTDASMEQLAKAVKQLTDSHQLVIRTE